jgi:hypothetical protein
VFGVAVCGISLAVSIVGGTLIELWMDGDIGLLFLSLFVFTMVVSEISHSPVC